MACDWLPFPFSKIITFVYPGSFPNFKNSTGTDLIMDHPVFSKEYLKEVPTKPGVYLMMDKNDHVLYVGKACDLRKRLASYQRSLSELHTKTGILLEKVCRIDTILTNTEKEALILEASLIKKHRPRYNVILRDDKNYPYLKVTVAEQWPRLFMCRRRVNDGSRYFGPYSSATAMHNTLRYLNKLFPLRRCNNFELRKRTRPCLNYQMGRCLAPCLDFVDPLKYKEMVDDVVLALEGRNRKLLVELKRRMAAAAERLEFEEAARCRDQIEAVSQTLEKQIVVASHFRDQDVFGFVRDQEALAVSVMFVREGIINGQRTFYLTAEFGENEQLLTELLERFYGDDQLVPEEIILPFEPEGSSLLSEWLSDLKGKRIKLKFPKRGEGEQLLSLATQNAQQLLDEKIRQGKAWDSLADAIARDLMLPTLPRLLECLDISNIGGQQAVGSLVSFIDGAPDKAGYRHYRIRDVTGPDDYAMISEVLTRRFAKLEKEGRPAPDLLIVDGGKGQLHAAQKVLTDLAGKKQIELAAIAKGREGIPDRIFRPGRKNPVVLASNSPLLLFFMRMRDEAHRFGVTFHRRLRNQATLQSALDTVHGLGPVKRKLLLKELGSMKRVEEATESELARIIGIGPTLARAIKKAFHST